jgi:hypothetical protein
MKHRVSKGYESNLPGGVAGRSSRVRALRDRKVLWGLDLVVEAGDLSWGNSARPLVVKLQFRTVSGTAYAVALWGDSKARKGALRGCDRA